MEEALLIQKAIEEIETKTWGVTEQFLEVHEIAYEDGKPKIARIDYEKKDVAAIIYFNVKGERFYFAIYFHSPDDLSIISVCVEPYNAVYLKASSEHLSLPALKAMTVLKPLREGNKGDLTKFKLVRKYSYMHIEPNPEAAEFED